MQSGIEDSLYVSFIYVLCVSIYREINSLSVWKWSEVFLLAPLCLLNIVCLSLTLLSVLPVSSEGDTAEQWQNDSSAFL